jgi:hypothetical protein
MEVVIIVLMVVLAVLIIILVTTNTSTPNTCGKTPNVVVNVDNGVDNGVTQSSCSLDANDDHLTCSPAINSLDPQFTDSQKLGAFTDNYLKNVTYRSDSNFSVVNARTCLSGTDKSQYKSHEKTVDRWFGTSETPNHDYGNLNPTNDHQYYDPELMQVVLPKNEKPAMMRRPGVPAQSGSYSSSGMTMSW